MNFMTGSCDEAYVMIHGGAGPASAFDGKTAEATEALKKIAQSALLTWNKKHQLELASHLLEGLEDEEMFNAGRGAALQSDGVARLSASLMDGRRRRFSAVISVSEVKHPSRLALVLQNKPSRVLTAPGTLKLARELEEPVADLITPARFDAWLARRLEFSMEATSCDTVGVVLSSDSHCLVAGSSTGGRGNEEPGRVSDSGTVAGNYASDHAAISVTGVGEQIVDDGVAVRIETRVRDGMSLEEACRRTYDEAVAAKHEYGWVASDAKGNWCVAHTTETMSYLVRTVSGHVLASS